MTNLQEVVKLSENFLVEYFNFNCIEEVKNHIDKNSIIGYEIFIKQIIFEIFYRSYIENNKEVKSIMDVYKRKIKQDDNVKSYECADDKEYAKLKRTYKGFRKYNDELAINHNKENDVQYVNIDVKDTNKKMCGQKIKRYQENQLLDINEFEIFKYIKDRSIVNSKSIDNYRLICGLKEIDRVYERINKTYDNYFERSIQYFQLEQGCRIETNYLIANAMSKVKKGLEEKKNDIKQFRCFFAVSFGTNSLQNKFIIGIEKYINEYVKNPGKITSIPMEIYELSLIKYNITKLVLGQLIINVSELNYIENDIFFKDYFGEGQHIIKDKKWEDIKLRNFRDLYSQE